jgi:hypothetical protein
MQPGRNAQGLEYCPPQPGHAGRADGTPPGLGFEGRSLLECPRPQSQQAVGDQAARGRTLERSEGAVATIGKAATRFSFVEDILDFAAGGIPFQPPLGPQREVGGKKAVQLGTRALRENDRANARLAQAPTGTDDPDQGVPRYALARDPYGEAGALRAAGGELARGEVAAPYPRAAAPGCEVPRRGQGEGGIAAQAAGQDTALGIDP